MVGDASPRRLLKRTQRSPTSDIKKISAPLLSFMCDFSPEIIPAFLRISQQKLSLPNFEVFISNSLIYIFGTIPLHVV